MTQRQLPHFERHIREMYRTRRRFRLAMASLIAVLFVVTGLRVAGTHAAGSYTISGRVYNASTGVGLANVKVYVCNFGTAVTSSTGNFTIPNASYGARYCVRYLSGAPSYVTGPIAVNDNAGLGDRSSYESQVAGLSCQNRLDCTSDERRWDRPADSGLDFAFTNVPGRSAVEMGLPVRPMVAPVPEAVLGVAATAPTVPADFQATVSGNNAVVTLSWTPSTGGTGTIVYKLERSLDQATWSLVSGTIGGPPYDDKSVDFGVHYYYRLSAVDGAGNTSGYTTSDATTTDYSSNTANDTSNSYTSDDSLVSVIVPAGALPTDADCSVTSVNIPASAKQPGSQSQPMVLGPYVFLCKTLGGDPINDFQKPVIWTVNLKGKLKNLVSPVPQIYSEGHTNPITPSKYDNSNQMLTFQMTSSDEVLVLASVPQGVSPNLVAVILVMAVLVAGVLVLVLRKKQKDTYNEYIRHKYYNL